MEYISRFNFVHVHTRPACLFRLFAHFALHFSRLWFFVSSLLASYFPFSGCFAAFRHTQTHAAPRQCVLIASEKKKERERESHVPTVGKKFSPFHRSVKRERVHLVVITRFNFVPDTPVCRSIVAREGAINFISSMLQ